MPGAGVGILSGGPLSEAYQILQLHFHWGKDNTKGSEHTYDGAAFPLEMHVVHVKSSLYSNLSSALSTTDGLAVTGFQFSIGVCNIGTIVTHFQVAREEVSCFSTCYDAFKTLLP